ncbi:MAG TPA: alpha/beta hydrolase [Gemmataceae bacterium]|nr:alpha/beta hydrolase [Gemmataceae bacterium]
MLLALEDRFLFRPTRAAADWCPPPNDRVRDLEWELRLGPRVHAWWCPTEDWRPSRGAVLYLHGNGGNLSHRGQALRPWHDEMRMAVLLFDYPGYGRSTGRPTEAGCYAAADAGYDWLTGALHVPAERVLLYGGSLGCAVAIDLARRRPHRAMVLVSAFTSVRDMAVRLVPWVPRRLVRDRFDNLAKIGKCLRPVFLAHGTADRLVPFKQGQRLFAAAPEPKEFFPMQGYDHQHTPGPDFYEYLLAFLTRAAPLPAD